MSNNADATTSKIFCFLVAGDFGTVIVHNSDEKKVADDIHSSDTKIPSPAVVDMKNLEDTNHAGYVLLLFYFIYTYEYYIRNDFCQSYCHILFSKANPCEAISFYLNVEF